MCLTSALFSYHVATCGHRPKCSLGDKNLAYREGDYKIGSGRGRKNIFQGMGRVWEEIFVPQEFCAKTWKREKIKLFSAILLKIQNSFNFFSYQGGGSP